MRIAILLLSLLFTTGAIAQDWPDLIGTWKGKSRSVVSGMGGHFSEVEAGKPSFAEVELTIEWTEAENGRYIGTVSSANRTERILAVASSDGTSLYSIDEDGFLVGRLIDHDHFELCYLQTDPGDTQMVASCVEYERQD